jgi:predicted Zn-dependent protease with MMP-like domain
MVKEITRRPPAPARDTGRGFRHSFNAMARKRFSRDAFEALVRRALAEIPARFRPYLDNVTVEAHDRPAPRILRELGLEDDEALYGYYQGTPLTARGPEEEPLYPDRIMIFQEPLEEDYADDAEEIVRQIRITVLHEIGHHFGLEDEDMEHLED